MVQVSGSSIGHCVLHVYRRNLCGQDMEHDDLLSMKVSCVNMDLTNE
ncbi:hypothetical protein SXCC_04506 [Gluconacetobacter sp. SXCC-1]|nr:hypothetical protein SXCC_04506 [Gluconacetobacter sp. SXCC-1]